MTTSLLTISNELADAAERASASVVQVQGRRRPASGVVFGAGLVVTSARALGREDGLHIRTADGQVHDAELAGWDAGTGLAVLRASGVTTPAIARASAPARVGNLAIALARSWSNSLTASAGIVSVIGGPLRTGHGRAIERVIRTNAPMHDGFAGGAFVDVTGALLGVNTSSEIRGLGVVIPADIALTVATSVAEHGSTQRGYLGIGGQPVELADRLRGSTPQTHALLVAAVSEGSPADAAGLLVGDVLTTFDGQDVRSPMDLLELLSGRAVGQAVPVRVLRGGVPHDIMVTIGQRGMK